MVVLLDLAELGIAHLRWVAWFARIVPTGSERVDMADAEHWVAEQHWD